MPRAAHLWWLHPAVLRRQNQYTFSVNKSSGNNGSTYDLTIDAGAFSDNLGNTNASKLTTGLKPAGIAGQPINLGLTEPTGQQAAVTLALTGAPSDWTMNEGTRNADGSWTVTTSNVAGLTVTTAAGFAGALVLNISESWTNADGSLGSAYISDNVESYPASPIFAVSSDDTLTGSAGNDTFVFAQPIGTDRVYDFDLAYDKLDLIGFGVSAFTDLRIDYSSGSAVLTLGSGGTINLVGITGGLTGSDRPPLGGPI